MEKLDVVLESLHPLERRVLRYIKDNVTVKDNVTADEISFSAKMQKVEAMRALQWLESKKALILNQKLIEVVELDKNGEFCIKKGFPEKRFLKALIESSKPLEFNKIAEHANLEKDEISSTLGILKKNKLIKIENGITITKQGEDYFTSNNTNENFINNLPKSLNELTKEEQKTLSELKSRKEIIKINSKKEFTVTLTDFGKKLANTKTDLNLIDTLTPQIIKSSSWKNKKFRRYDISAPVGTSPAARRHITSQTIDYIRRIWLDMGFKEMTGPLTESSFWNFDALFTPQDHPARELQDTFFLDESIKKQLPKEIVKRVKAVHENGWTTGSIGWKIPWSEEEAKKPVLITHDTYLSAQVLSKISKKDLPVKTFQIMKVFRNEAVDWKHLFEFYQVGGIVVGKEANFRNLLGYLKQFFGKMGFTDVRLRPAHFPYTEPSCEVEVLDPKKKQWVELGGSGIFRPEVVKPLLGIDVPVLAWGLGLERIVKDYYKIQDLRDIYKNDLKQLRESKLWLK